MSQEGAPAYDTSIGSYVLVVAVPLAHLADSPMHAEISNTNNPGSSLHPCRVCHLGADSKAMKRTEAFIRSFVGINSEGVMVFESLSLIQLGRRTDMMFTCSLTARGGIGVKQRG